MRGTVENGATARFSTRRIEALTDGVFAIAMTLLVLDLKVSELGVAATSGQLLQAIAEHSQSLLSFTVSFMVLGAMWAVHMRQFEYIKQADKLLTTMNTSRLFIVVLIPFATSLAGNYQSLALGRVALPVCFFLLALIGYIQWHYAMDPARGLGDRTLLASAQQETEIRNRSILLVAFLVILVSIWIGDIAFVLLFLVAIPMSLLRRRLSGRESNSI